jgi:hypothetical protein
MRQLQKRCFFGNRSGAMSSAFVISFDVSRGAAAETMSLKTSKYKN